MENKDTPIQENWQQVMQEFADEPQQPNAQQPQQYAQQPQQYAQQPQQYAQQPQQYAQQQYQYAQQPMGVPQYNASSFTVVPIKKKSKAPLIVLIIILAAALIAGGIFLFFHFFRGDGGYEKMERGFFAGVGDKVGTAMESAESAVSSGKGGWKFNAALDAGENYANTVLDGELYYDEQGNVHFEAKLKANDDEYLSIYAWQKDGKFIMQIPELSDMYITNSESGATGSQLATGLDGYVTEPLMFDTASFGSYGSNSYNLILTMMQNLLGEIDNETLERITNILLDSYFEIFTGEDEKSADLTVGENVIHCKSITVKFTYEKLFKFLSSLLDKLSNDSVIKGLLQDAGVLDTVIDTKSRFDDVINQLDSDTLATELLNMVVYYDNNEVIGRAINMNGQESIKLVHQINDEQINLALSAGGAEAYFTGKKNGEMYDVTAGATRDGSAVFTGKGSFKYSDTAFSGSFDLDIPSSGTYTVTLDSLNENDKMTVNAEFSLNGQKAGALSMDCEPTEFKEIVMPQNDASNTVSTKEPYSDAYQQYVQDIANSLSKLRDKISGLPKADVFGTMIYYSLSGMGGYDTDYDYDYDSDYDSDYDYDFDSDYDSDYEQQEEVTYADYDASMLKLATNVAFSDIETQGGEVSGPAEGGTTYGIIGIAIGDGTENKYGSEGNGSITLSNITVTGKNPSGGEWSADNNKAVIEEFRKCLDTNFQSLDGGYGLIFIQGKNIVQAIWCSDANTVKNMTAPITAWEQDSVGVINGVAVGTDEKVYTESFSLTNA